MLTTAAAHAALDEAEGRLFTRAESLTAGTPPERLRAGVAADVAEIFPLAQTGVYKPRIEVRAKQLRARQCGLLSAICMGLGEIRMARAHAFAGRTLARMVEDREAEVYAQIRLANVELHHGSLRIALESAARAMDLATPLRVTHPDLYAWATSLLARGAARRDHKDIYMGCRKILHEIAPLLPVGDSPMNAFTVTAQQIEGAAGAAAADMGDSEALRILDRALEGYPKSARMIIHHTELNKARALVKLDRIGDGLDLAEQVLTATGREHPDDLIDKECVSRTSKILEELGEGGAHDPQVRRMRDLVRFSGF